MRNGFDGLSGIVRNELHRDPLSGEVFIFLNRGRKLIKLLQWQAGGFLLYYKRLEKGTFSPPKMEAGSHQVNWPEVVHTLKTKPSHAHPNENTELAAYRWER
eukprot:gene1031-1307_t